MCEGECGHLGAEWCEACDGDGEIECPCCLGGGVVDAISCTPLPRLVLDAKRRGRGKADVLASIRTGVEALRAHNARTWHTPRAPRKDPNKTGTPAAGWAWEHERRDPTTGAPRTQGE